MRAFMQVERQITWSCSSACITTRDFCDRTNYTHRAHQDPWVGRAAVRSGSASSSFARPGYHRSNRDRSVSSRVRVLVCNSRCASAWRRARCRQARCAPAYVGGLAAMLDRSCARHRRRTRSGRRKRSTSRTGKHSTGGQFPLSPRDQFLMSLDRDVSSCLCTAQK